MELRMRVRKSATGSVRFIHSPSFPVRSAKRIAARTSGNVVATIRWSYALHLENQLLPDFSILGG
jgi:hypothetical protein